MNATRFHTPEARAQYILPQARHNPRGWHAIAPEAIVYKIWWALNVAREDPTPQRQGAIWVTLCQN